MIVFLEESLINIIKQLIKKIKKQKKLTTKYLKRKLTKL